MAATPFGCEGVDVGEAKCLENAFGHVGGSGGAEAGDEPPQGGAHPAEAEAGAVEQ
jgi:hypothetical protein